MDDMEYEMNDDAVDEQDVEYFFGMYSISDFCDFPVCPF